MSEFASGGREKFPSLYHDEQQVGEFSRWPQGALERIRDEYCDFLRRDDLMPRAINSAERILLHVIFELDYRSRDGEE